MIKSLQVSNVRCSGCATTITKALQEAGFEDIDVDLSCEPRVVTFKSDETEANVTHAISILKNLGYPLHDEKIDALDAVGLKAKSFISCAVGKIG
jgi:copper chaperone